LCEYSSPSRCDLTPSIHTAYTSPFTFLRAKFITSCQLFDKGGDYALEETRMCETRLATVNATVKAEVDGERRSAVEALRGEQQEALAVLDGFNHAYEASLQDLSMREGLGKKYGGPRRNAQERLRTEVSRSDRTAGSIDAQACY
jgi:hypothetical protein